MTDRYSIALSSQSMKRYHQRIRKSVTIRKALPSHFNYKYPDSTLKSCVYSKTSDEMMTQ